MFQGSGDDSSSSSDCDASSDILELILLGVSVATIFSNVGMIPRNVRGVCCWDLDRVSEGIGWDSNFPSTTSAVFSGGMAKDGAGVGTTGIDWACLWARDIGGRIMGVAKVVPE